MKRIAALILTILYFLTSTGATMNHHYCMGEMINSSLWMNKEKKCGKCGMEDNKNENNGCCNDVQQWVDVWRRVIRRTGTGIRAPATELVGRTRADDPQRSVLT